MHEHNLGQALAALRKARCLALQDVANRTGVSAGEIVRYEQGGTWSVEQLLAALDAMGADLADLQAAAEGRCWSVEERIRRACGTLEGLADELVRQRRIGSAG